MFQALQTDSLKLHLLTDANWAAVDARLEGLVDAAAMREELAENYRPQVEDGRRTNFGFYALQAGELMGFSLLTIDSWKERIGSTGADTLMHRRGQGVAPRSKPHLFYLAFELLGLNRVESGCLVSNIASKRSIEKTPGFQFEGVARESGLNEAGEFEDQYIYAILRRDWLRLYDKAQVTVLR